MNIKDQIFVGNALKILPTFPSKLIQTCVTSPPFYGLRDYNTASWEGGDPNCEHRTSRDKRSDNSEKQKSNRGNVHGSMEIKSGQNCPLCGALRIDEQIGLESSLDEYVLNLTKVFHHIRELMRNDGTLWLNLGDSYAVGGKLNSDGRRGFSKSDGLSYMDKSTDGLHPKNLLGVPWKVAFSLQKDGWILRQEIIWKKLNPMPEPVTDRPTRAHEQIFLFSKTPKYYYDCDSIRSEYRTINEKYNTNMKGKNKRSVWETSIGVNKSAHYAVFPPELITPCIKAGAPEGGLVLDPFMGSGTVAYVSKRLDRRYVGIDLNPDNVKMSNERLTQEELFNG